MTAFDVAYRRLHNQSIAPAACETPGEVVKRLGAIQAQDYLGALWAVGLRLPRAVEADIEQAIANGEIIRTWPMRGTLHFITPDDLRWMLPLLAPRIMARAAQKGLICFGPRRGKEETFVLLDEWLPEGKTLSREEALAELTKRYFAGHGPATIRDFVWWSGLPAAEARAGLEMVEPQLAHEALDGQTYWFVSASSSPKSASPAAYLLPSFDEYLLGYKDRSAVLDPAHAKKVVPGANGIFKPIIVIGGRVVGTWQRTLRKTKVMVTFETFTSLSPTQMEAAAEPYGRFLGLPVEISR